MSQAIGAEDPNGANNIFGPRNLPGPATPPPPSRPVIPTIRPHFPNPLNIPRLSVMNIIPPVRLPPPPVAMMPGHLNRPSFSMNVPNIPLQPPRLPTLLMPQVMPPPPPIPEEPEPKRQRLDDSVLLPEDQFQAWYSGFSHGPARINVLVQNLGGNMKGRVLQITVQSLSETISSLKEKIAGEIQLPANKQKLSGKAGFLKDNLSLGYYNVAPWETMDLSLKERGGRKR